LIAEQLFAESPAMREVASLIQRMGPVRAGVLIRGEDGTGRRVVASAIHSQAKESGPFLTVDCGAVPPEALEREIFGSCARPEQDERRGIERVHQRSLLNNANGGTLYLRNIAEAPARVQARLARVLRDREALLIETGRTTALDVRPMAGVDPNFDDGVREGRVREDLFRRLAAVRIELPALRNRRDDIPALAKYFVQEICVARQLGTKTVSRPVLSLVAALPWRGNAVELRALLDSVLSGLDGNSEMGIEDVLVHLRLDGGSVVCTNGGTLRQARARFEREYIVSMLDQHHGRITETAKALGIQRTNLYRKMRSLRVGRIKKDTSPVSS
jgi:DNA-binding NtrC family response regulator